MRRVWAGLVVAVWVGVAPAQPPQPTGDILVQKTAGQPERRLKLLKMDTGPDGERVADLQDLTTGMRYTVPVAALAGMKRVSGEPIYPGPTPVIAPSKPVATGGKFPTSMLLPEPTPGGHSPFVARQYSPPPPPQTRQQPAVPVAPAALDTPLTTLVAPPSRPVEPPPLTVTPPTTPRPMPATKPAPEPMPPFALKDTAPPRPPAPAMPEVEPVRLQIAVPAAPPPTVAPWQMTRSEQMRAEIEPYANDLVNALRPSVRERAATALANTRHASHAEVKGLLAQTARTDPAPSVQAHCVRLLAALGYHEQEYVEFLEVSLGSETPALRQAAAAALAKLAPR